GADAPYPRWSGWASLWFCFATFPASLVAFLKDGPFAWDGVLAFWVPLSALFAWVILMTVLTLRAVKKQSTTEGHLFDPTEPTQPTAVAV
ncbi:hypothetical protein, partial [Micromonospora sp. WMMD736]|uniref:hypothetical protein n=1 Tax=Micromonospora sp. WMMD736 TaxID=3404112 RepID=UPI003B94F8E8